jgi:ribosomal protein L37AE/L43A
MEIALTEDCAQCFSVMNFSEEFQIFKCEGCGYETDGESEDEEIEYMEHKCLACNSGLLSWSIEESIWICGSCGR